MRILELEIDNLRGIRHLKLKPEGRNFLISGPNGSGKSAIVDAIDFLLTGDISRMKGKGTKGITLKKHGPHIDAKPKDSCVKAVVKLHEVKEPVQIKRTLDNNKKLIIDDSYKETIEPILELASRGQHVLTRREILNFVTAEAGTRAGQVQKLLKLDSIEEHRKKLGAVRNTLRGEFQSAESSLNRALGEISVTIAEEDVTPEKVLEFINKQRTILLGVSLDNVDSSQLKEDIHPPTSQPGSRLNPEILKKDLQNIDKITSNDLIRYKDEELRELACKFSSSPLLGGAVKRLKLTRLGLELLDDDGLCPLCETSWEPSKLKEQLESRLNLYQEAREDLDRVEELSQDLLGCINRLMASIKEVENALQEWELSEIQREFKAWLQDLEVLAKSLEDLEQYPLSPFPPDKVANLLAPENLSSLLKKIETIIGKMSPENTPEQTAWDQLTRLEENLKLWAQARGDYNSSYESYKRSAILLDTFLTAREKILNQLFIEIKDRFVELYRELHGIDEAEFEASLVSSGAGIDFQVEFHGRGEHPPHALHSEGHQDSMGICLYLALAERLTGGYIDLIVLDDVMMSVDAPHRRQICHLLADFFKGRQFFITTHDQTWARQLQTEGVVRSRDRIELTNWTIENGPSINYMGDIWDPIQADLSENDVPAAAAKLRRGSEEYFSLVCSSLQAPVRFNFGGQYELGDLLSGAMSTYNRLIKKAKTAARSWDNEDELERLRKVQANSKDIFERINLERWAVNPAVHYNNWTDFTPQDFKPVVESFKGLYSVFQCDNCETIIHLVMNGINAEAVKCNCGSVNWNLKGK